MLSNYYPPVGFYFKVNVEGFMGVNEGSFQEVSGLNVTLGTEDVKEGGENRFVYRLPTPPKYNNLVLKRGMVIGSSLITWARNAVENFTFAPKNVNINLLDVSGAPIAAWRFSKAYPIALKISDFKAQDNNTVVLETLELAFTTFQRTN